MVVLRIVIGICGHDRALSVLVDSVRREVRVGGHDSSSDLLLAFAVMTECQMRSSLFWGEM